MSFEGGGHEGGSRSMCCVCSLSIQESNVTLEFVGMTLSDLLHHFNPRFHLNSSHRVYVMQL